MRTTTRSATGREQRAAILTELFDAALAGTAPWQREWSADDLAQLTPRNAATGRRYTGGNVLWLWLAQLALGTDDARWVTYKQAQDAGWQVRKGAKSVQLVKVGSAPRTREKDALAQSDGEDAGSYFFLKTFSVFHASDVDGIPALAPVERARPSQVAVPEALTRLIATGDANVSWRRLPAGVSPSYAPLLDHLTLPLPEQFPTPEALSAVALHELAHWTGHSTRAARELGGSFGSPAYAAEELVADTAAFLTAGELSLGHSPQNTAAYLRSWSGKDRSKLEGAVGDAIAASAALVQLAHGKTPAAWQRAAARRAA